MKEERRRKTDTGWLPVVGGVGALTTVLLNLISEKTISDYPDFLVAPTPGAFLGLAVFSLCLAWGYFKIVCEGNRSVLDLLAVLTITYGIILFSSIETRIWVISLVVILGLEIFTALFVHH